MIRCPAAVKAVTGGWEWLTESRIRLCVLGVFLAVHACSLIAMVTAPRGIYLGLTTLAQMVFVPTVAVLFYVQEQRWPLAPHKPSRREMLAAQARFDEVMSRPDAHELYIANPRGQFRYEWVALHADGKRYVPVDGAYTAIQLIEAMPRDPDNAFTPACRLVEKDWSRLGETKS